MSFVIKTKPFDAEIGQSVLICERPYYGGAEVEIREEAFVWFSETQGGSGLAWSGVIERVDHKGERICITVQLSNRVSRQSLTVASLEPFLDRADGKPMSGLARKLYRHSHNKIAALRADEAKLLREYMG